MEWLIAGPLTVVLACVFAYLSDRLTDWYIQRRRSTYYSTTRDALAKVYRLPLDLDPNFEERNEILAASQTNFIVDWQQEGWA